MILKKKYLKIHFVFQNTIQFFNKMKYYSLIKFKDLFIGKVHEDKPIIFSKTKKTEIRYFFSQK